mmetsp:Transcript_927/g.1911  ORF Transcript_927/g.1911 Transcript_927/m.1911 type:complete len:261 (+) Transcript_927:1234-2016(+)
MCLAARSSRRSRFTQERICSTPPSSSPPAAAAASPPALEASPPSSSAGANTCRGTASNEPSLWWYRASCAWAAATSGVSKPPNCSWIASALVCCATATSGSPKLKSALATSSKARAVERCKGPQVAWASAKACCASSYTDSQLLAKACTCATASSSSTSPSGQGTKQPNPPPLPHPAPVPNGSGLSACEVDVELAVVAFASESSPSPASLLPLLSSPLLSHAKGPCRWNRALDHPGGELAPAQPLGTGTASIKSDTLKGS